MEVYLSGHPYHFECENLCRVFFPYSPVKRVDTPRTAPAAAPYFEAVIIQSGDTYLYKVLISQNGKILRKEQTCQTLVEYNLTRLVFDLFVTFTGIQPLWGMLTGIHPVKLLREYSQSLGRSAAADLFQDQFLVSKEKTDRCLEIMDVQQPVLTAVTPLDFSLYVGIPFCPTRCSYCSFVSQDIASAGKLIDPYYVLLLQELRETARITASIGLSPISVYIGGGTPTTLSASQLSGLCETIQTAFDLTRCTEFTVEAGRPDTITAEKLQALKAAGVSRISINPQSCSDEVLRNIGRAHTAADVEAAFSLARAAGFPSINSDLIVGLPGDRLQSFADTLSKVITYGASNITIHALALKRTANLLQENRPIPEHKDSDLVRQMARHADHTLLENHYQPYYLYRQTRMAGNLENTGWAKGGDLCCYNIHTMDETNTIIACGAGGVSKIVDPYSRQLQRIFNFKHTHEYIRRHNEMLERKKGVIELYEQFRKRVHEVHQPSGADQ